MNEIIKNQENIKAMIYKIRGKEVILDSDLAKLYQCKNGTKSINLSVKRHLNRFPERFMFQLTEDELKNLRFQRETANNKSRTLPYVFTEQGIAMLATILKSDVAVNVSIAIMDAFVAMRHIINNNIDLYQSIENINNKLLAHDKDIKKLFNKFDYKSKTEYLFFEGQIYDAYSKIIDILKEAKNEIVIIDGYADKSVLDLIKDINAKIILIVKSKALLKDLDILKYNEQYNNLIIKYDDSFHDRYIIIDKKIIYHLGASLNHIGKKTFNINRLEDKDIINLIIKKSNIKE